MCKDMVLDAALGPGSGGVENRGYSCLRIGQFLSGSGMTRMTRLGFPDTRFWARISWSKCVILSPGPRLAGLKVTRVTKDVQSEQSRHFCPNSSLLSLLSGIASPGLQETVFWSGYYPREGGLLSYPPRGKVPEGSQSVILSGPALVPCAKCPKVTKR